jgi:hypothetical protein
MWIFLSNAMLSIVQDRSDADRLLVRARVKGDIEAIFAGYEPMETPTADYRFRASIPRRIVAERVKAELEVIDYDNFKNSVPDHARHMAYMEVWSAMHDEQERRLRRRRG